MHAQQESGKSGQKSSKAVTTTETAKTTESVRTGANARQIPPWVTMAWGDEPLPGLMLQAKLSVSQPGDKYEQEADRISQQVMRMPEPQLQRACTCGGACPTCQTERLDQEHEHLQTQRARSDDLGQTTAPPSVHDILRSPGQPLDTATRAFMEPRFGYDFSHVRVHSGTAAEQSARDVNAHAYTVGHDMVFGAGRFAPGTHEGRGLLAHELTHVVQQNSGMTLVQRIPTDNPQRRPNEATARSHGQFTAAVASTPFLEAGWTDVNEPGVIYKEGTEAEKGGAYLREAPDVKSNKLAWLPQNTKVHILRHNDQSSWYAVAAITEKGLFGYVADWLVARNPPDPDAGIVKIKPGDTPLELAARYYTGQGFDQWGKDKRYVVNALVWVNAHAKHNFRGDSVLQKKSTKVGWTSVEGGVEAPWWTAQVQSGGYMWLPGKDYLNAIYEEVRKHGGGTGSITADLWHTLKHIYHYVAYGLAFVGGLVHGFFQSLWDAISGVVGLVYDILKSVFTLHVISDAEELIGAIEKMTWQDIKNAVGEWADKWAEKLNSDSPWIAGHAHGYLTGYVMAEAAMLLLSGGVLAEAKGALWGSRLGKALQETRALKAFAEAIEKAGEISAKARKALQETREALEATRAGKAIKVAETAGKAIVWTAAGIGKVLNLPADIVAHLTEAAIARLKRLEPWFERIKELSAPAKRWLFGCHETCELEVSAVEKAMGRLTNDEIEEAAKLASKPVPKSTELPEPKPSERLPQKEEPGLQHPQAAELSPAARRAIDTIEHAVCGTCFPAGTKVLTKEGYKNIEDIDVGDFVLARDEHVREGIAYKRVAKTFRNTTDALIEITAGNQVIRSTPGHVWWTVEKGWTFAQNVEIGDLVITSNGDVLQITEVRYVNEITSTFNCEVEEYHTYFVAASDKEPGIWVHNTSALRILRPDQVFQLIVPNIVISNREAIRGVIGRSLNATGKYSTELKGFFAYLRGGGGAGFQGVTKDAIGRLETVLQNVGEKGGGVVAAIDLEEIGAQRIFDLTDPQLFQELLDAYPRFEEMFTRLAGEGVVAIRGKIPARAVQSLVNIPEELSEAEKRSILETLLKSCR